MNARLLGIPKGRPIEVAAYFNNFSTSYQGMYGGLSFRASDLTYQRAKLFPRGSSDESQGIDYVQRIRIPRNLFLEAGYSFSVPWDQAIPAKWEGLKKFLEKRPIQARLGVAGPLIWGRAQSTEVEARNEALVADQRTHGVEFRLTLHVRLGNLGSDGGHPFEKTGGKK